jgi:site-specific DNA-methyltransferase (adenine-specific)
VLEPGGRIAVNVANLGRKPYRSLSGEVVRILQRLGFLIRGEHIWIKAESQSRSTAFGSWMSPSNPVMRDLTERIVIASHGQFGRVGSVKARREMGRPWQATISKEQFMAWTYDTWRIRPESAHRVGHPAAFPVELPERLIRLHTYAGEVVLDPFCGAGATGVAAVRTARGFIGYDLNNRYIERTRERLAVDSQPEVA